MIKIEWCCDVKWRPAGRQELDGWISKEAFNPEKTENVRQIQIKEIFARRMKIIPHPLTVIISMNSVRERMRKVKVKW